MPLVIIPAAYRGPTKGQAEVAVAGASVRECLEAVESQFPGFLDMVVDGGGVLHCFVKVFLDGEQIDPADLDLEVSEGTRVEVLAAIAGGS